MAISTHKRRIATEMILSIDNVIFALKEHSNVQWLDEADALTRVRNDIWRLTDA